jgi:hypothetical protein
VVNPVEQIKDACSFLSNQRRRRLGVARDLQMRGRTMSFFSGAATARSGKGPADVGMDNGVDEAPGSRGAAVRRTWHRSP